MARTPEGKVKDKVVDILKSEGVYYFFPVTGGFGASGVPDIVACAEGRFLAIECKAGGGKLTTLQAHAIERIRMAGGCAVVVHEDNLDELRALVRRLKHKVAVA
jgi:Holliday junction resolvase